MRVDMEWMERHIDEVRAFLAQDVNLDDRATGALVEEAEDMLSWLAVAQPADKHARGIPIYFFDNAVPRFDGTNFDPDSKLRPENGWFPEEEAPFIGEVDETLLGRPLHQTSIIRNDRGSFDIVGIHRVPHAHRSAGTFRAMHSMHKNMYLVLLCSIDRYGKYTVQNEVIVHPGKDVWLDARTGRSTDDEMIRTLHKAMSFQFEERYEWSFSLHFGKSRTGIRMHTDAVGVRDVLKNRTPKPRPGRRAALLHWVNEHFRRRRSGTKGLVRDHLRGKTEFWWYSFYGKVRPSDFDRERSCNGARFEDPVLVEGIDEHFQLQQDAEAVAGQSMSPS